MFGHLCPDFQRSWTKPIKLRCDMEFFLDAVEKATTAHSWLEGPPGCGKNELTRAIPNFLGVPVVMFTFHGGADADTLLGTTQLVEENGLVVTKHVVSPLLRAMEQPGFIGLHEINTVPPEYLFALHEVMEMPSFYRELQGRKEAEPYTVTTPDGMEVKIHPACRLVLTANAYRNGTVSVGTGPVAAALKNRCVQTEMEAPKKFGWILKSEFPELSALDQKLCDKLWNSILQHASNVGIETVTDVGYRNFQRATTHMLVYQCSMKDALVKHVISAIEDPVMMEGVRQALMAM
jgi:hypothetical protein